MVFFYALQRRYRGFILAFAGACRLDSIQGLLQGAWPFGAVELVWSTIAFNRWRQAKRTAEVASQDQKAATAFSGTPGKSVRQ